MLLPPRNHDEDVGAPVPPMTDAELIDLLVKRIDLEVTLKDWLRDELVKSKVKAGNEFNRGFERGLACARLVKELKRRNEPWRL